MFVNFIAKSLTLSFHPCHSIVAYYIIINSEEKQEAPTSGAAENGVTIDSSGWYFDVKESVVNLTARW